MSYYSEYIKRFFDFILATLAFIVLSPLLVVVAIMIKIKLGSPVVFKQARPGKDEKIFYLLKFRSMTNEKGEDGRLLPDAKRLTKFGKFLRASSLDELLELLNIIKGDMSIVGPRPLSIYYLPHYPTLFRKRHTVRPGLTGLAQVSGRNKLPWNERFLKDVEYIDHISFSLDCKIIIRTILKVLKKSDIVVRGTNKVKDYGPYTILKEQGKSKKKVYNMKYSEIGSYFWLEEDNILKIKSNENGLTDLFPCVEDSSFTFSGRSAIDVALRDILDQRKVNTVYVPSYSCVSMLQAFIDRGINIVFYNITYKNGSFGYEIPAIKNGDVVLVMSYFGLSTEECHNAIEQLHKLGAIIIEDITHSLLRDDAASEKSDYVVASLRKWFAIPTGGWVGKKKGHISQKPWLNSNHAVKDKIEGMREKYEYLSGRIKDKENFLLIQSKFDNDLIHADRMLAIDDLSLSIIKSLNINKIKAHRQKNVEILLNGLKDLTDYITFPNVDLDRDVLLFLPIFMKTEYRDSLRSYLIEHGIYCPIHWPEVMGANKGIRENELSLICDQRYCEDDMHAIVTIIHEWRRTVE